MRGTSKGPLFIFGDGTRLKCESFVLAVHKALSAAGVDTSKYAGHSFHIGVDTMAAKLGIQDYLIRRMGWWKSSAYLLYIRTPKEKISFVAKMLSTMASGDLTSNSRLTELGSHTFEN